MTDGISLTNRQEMLSQLRHMMVIAPEAHLDKQMRELVEKWDAIPKAIQILEVLDTCIYAALASGFTITVFQQMLTAALEEENTTLEAILPLATWRNRD